MEKITNTVKEPQLRLLFKILNFTETFVPSMNVSEGGQ